MNITYIAPTVEAMLETVMDFQGEGATDFWAEPLYRFYPQLDREYARSLPVLQRKEYFDGQLRSIFTELQPQLTQKAADYAAHWAVCRPQVEAALSDAFGLDCADSFNDLTCRVSLAPYEPRFLRERTFDTFYLNSPRGAVGSALHEIIHFVWFSVWHKLFQDDYGEYETPALKWILSEMVVEPIMRDPRLSSINPFFPREQGGCVYPYFYTLEIEGRPMLDRLYDMLKSRDIHGFMWDSYDLCRQHETTIREHIRKAEQQ